LMHSGIGQREHLTEMNIECKIDLPGVGENLIDHPIVSDTTLDSFVLKLLSSSRFIRLTM